MRHAVIISLVFHAVIMASGMVALPLLRPDEPTVMKIIPIEMVRIGDITKLKAQEKEPAKNPDPVTKKKAPERKVEMPPAPPKLASTMPLPDMKAKPKPKKMTPEKPPKVSAKRAPDITPKAKPSRFSTGKLAALLDKREKTAPSAFEKIKDKDYGKEKIISTIDIQQQTLSIIDAVSKHIYDNQCWNIPAGAKGAEGLLVSVQIRLSPDGRLIGAPKITDDRRMNLPGQEFYRTAAESVLRAVRKCAPYDFLPKAQYDLWRDMTINFNPEHMLNG